VRRNVGRRGKTWFYRLDLPPGPDGRRHQKRVSGFRTEREAREAFARASVAKTEGRLRHTEAKTFAELAGEWIDAVGPNRKETTVSNYRFIIDTYLVPRIGGVPLGRLTAPVVQRMYVALRSSGRRDGSALSGTQVRNIHRVLHNILGYATRMGYVTINPTDRVERPRDDTAERVVYSPDQVRVFLESARSDRLHALWYLAISTGLRRSEIAGLQWTDVDLDGPNPSISVRHTRTMANGRVIESTPKTRASRRTIVLDQGTINELLEHREVMEAEAQARGERKRPDDVFADELGKPYKPVRITRLLHGLQRKAALPQITLHDIRHTSATVALLAGVHPKVVSERHGHASTQITLDRYSHVVESMQRAAADSIDRYLSRVPRPEQAARSAG
jgi:integrase